MHVEVSLGQKVEKEGVISNKELQFIPPVEFLREYSRRHEPTGTWAYDAFDKLNEQFFEGKLTLPIIQWAPTEWGSCYGKYLPEYQKIILHPSLLRKGSKAWGPINPLTRMRESNQLLGVKFAEHVLLHELMHHKNSLDYGVLAPQLEEEKHNNQPWVDEINRIAPLLGLNIKAHICTQKRFKKPGEKGPGKPRVAPPDSSYIDFEFVYSFPHKLMPPGYYEKATEQLLKQSFKM